MDWKCPTCGTGWPPPEPGRPRPDQTDVDAGKITPEQLLFLQTCSEGCAEKFSDKLLAEGKAEALKLPNAVTQRRNAWDGLRKIGILEGEESS